MNDMTFFQTDAANDTAAYYPTDAYDTSFDWLSIENYHVKQQISSYLQESEEDSGITLTGLRKLAKSAGVTAPEKLTDKADLIRAIQIASYHQPCFQTDISPTCKTEDCNWRFACKKMVAAWRRTS
jgi:hypothetical protein